MMKVRAFLSSLSLSYGFWLFASEPLSTPQAASFSVAPDIAAEFVQHYAYPIHESAQCGKVYRFDPSDFHHRFVGIDADFLAYVDAGSLVAARPSYFFSFFSWPKLDRSQSYSLQDASIFLSVKRDGEYDFERSFSQLRQDLDRHLLEKLRKIAFREFRNEMRGISFFSARGDDVEDLFDELFVRTRSRMPLTVMHEIDLIHTFFPEIEDQIMNQDGDYFQELRPLLCYVNQDRLTYHRAQYASQLLASAAFAASFLTMMAASQGLVIPVLAGAATVVGITSGAVDVSLALHRMGYHAEAGRIASSYQKIAENLALQLDHFAVRPQDFSEQKQQEFRALNQKFEVFVARRRENKKVMMARVANRSQMIGAFANIAAATAVEVDPGILGQLISWLDP